MSHSPNEYLQRKMRYALEIATPGRLFNVRFGEAWIVEVALREKDEAPVAVFIDHQLDTKYCMTQTLVQGVSSLSIPILPRTDLHGKIAEVSREIKPRQIWQHTTNGNLYRVDAVAIDIFDSPVVVYHELGDKTVVWTRPVGTDDGWRGMVDYQGTKAPRFMRVNLIP